MPRDESPFEPLLDRCLLIAHSGAKSNEVEARHSVGVTGLQEQGNSSPKG